MSDSKLRVMAVGAHPADTFDRGGGTLAKHIQAGDEVMVVSLTYGVRSHAGGAFDGHDPSTPISAEEIQAAKEIKRRETEGACAVMGVQHLRNLDVEDAPLVFSRAEYDRLSNLIREFRPDIMLCHSTLQQGHPDHGTAGWIAWNARTYAAGVIEGSPLPAYHVPTVYLFWYTDYASQQTMNTTALQGDFFVDITEVRDLKIRSWMEFKTQGATREALERRLEMIERACGAACGVQYAERFLSTAPACAKRLLPRSRR